MNTALTVIANTKDVSTFTRMTTTRLTREGARLALLELTTREIKNLLENPNPERVEKALILLDGLQYSVEDIRAGITDWADNVHAIRIED